MTQRRNLMKPLAAVMPPRHMAHLVASRSYLSYSKEALQDKLKHNPYSYIQVINPDASSHVDSPRGTSGFYEAVRQGYDAFKNQGWLQESPQQEWLVYRQSQGAESWTGIVCNLDLGLCRDGRLKTHEQTLETREGMFANFLEHVGFHAEPILCAHPNRGQGHADAATILASVTEDSAHTDFMTADGVRHQIWRVDATSPQGHVLNEAWNQTDALYLADGHHRLASSQRLAKARPDLPGAQEILAFVVPQDDLTIHGFHKEIRGVHADTDAIDQALNALGCDVHRVLDGREMPSQPGEILVMHRGTTWSLVRPEGEEGTDAEWVNVHLLGRVLGVEDPRNDPKLRHRPAVERPSTGWLSSLKDHDDRLLVLIHPIPFDQIIDVADREGTLPPKSTWVEPKLRSALFIHEFDTEP